MKLAIRRYILETLRNRIAEALRDQRSREWVHLLLEEYSHHCKELTKELETKR